MGLSLTSNYPVKSFTSIYVNLTKITLKQQAQPITFFNEKYINGERSDHHKELPKIILNKIELDYKEIYFTKA